MPSIDMPLEQLREYKPALYRENDFDEFWKSTVADAIRQPLKIEMVPYALNARGLEFFSVRFEGFGGGRIAGWYARPIGAGKFPGLCIYHGYSQRGPRPLELIQYAAQGIAVLSMDCRGQNGQSQDAALYPEGQHAGWMTAGIRDPKTYYFRYVYTDAVRALELLARRDEVDEERLAITGISQGGGITLAVAALSSRPKLALSDIPFLCDYRRAIQITSVGPYPEIPNFLKMFPHLHDQAIRTLSYCDCMNLSPWIKCETVVCNCLWDDVCPPSTIFAAYNHITARKQIEIYPFHKHETPYEHHERKFKLLMQTLQA